MSPGRNALLGMIGGTWGGFLMLTFAWFVLISRFASAPYPFWWIVLGALLIGAMLAHGLWRVARAEDRRRRAADG